MAEMVFRVLFIASLLFCFPSEAGKKQCPALVTEAVLDNLIPKKGAATHALGRLLFDVEEMSGQDLLAASGQPKGTLYTTLRRMIEDGLVEQRTDAKDGRVRVYSLTKTGKKWAESSSPSTYQIAVGSAVSTIGHEEARLLIILSEKNEMTGAEFWKRFGESYPHGTLYTTLRRLEKRGFLRKSVGPADGRERIFSITPEGQAVSQQISEQIRQSQ